MKAKSIIIILAIVLSLLLIVSLAGCGSSKELAPGEVADKTVPDKPGEINKQTSVKGESPGAETVTLETSDGIKIIGSYYPNEKAETGIILLHMLGRNRHDWDDFALDLDNYHAVLSIDLRGHGDSDLNFNDFKDEYFISMKNDIRAAKEFLKEKGYSKFSIIGASLGANLALVYAKDDTSIKSVVVLSPGDDYKNVKPINAIYAMGGRAMFFAASADDKYAYESTTRFHENAPGTQNKLVTYEDAGHGTNMLASTTLGQEILRWYSEITT